MVHKQIHKIVFVITLLLVVIVGSIIFIKNNGNINRSSGRTKKVQVVNKTPDDTEDICSIKNSLTVPYVYRQTVSLASLPVAQRKKTFISMVLPAFMVAKHRITMKKERAERIRNCIVSKQPVSNQDSTFFVDLFKQYKAKSWPELKRKLTPHPVSIAIAQAAIESGWGTSRFFTEANNFTGMWSYNEQEERLEAMHKRNGRDIHVRAYNDLVQGALDYFATLARVPAYRSFRKSRVREDDPFQLVARLTPYSERGRQYTEQVKTIMRQNRLTRYDEYRIHPAYLKTKHTNQQTSWNHSWFAWSHQFSLPF